MVLCAIEQALDDWVQPTFYYKCGFAVRAGDEELAHEALRYGTAVIFHNQYLDIGNLSAGKGLDGHGFDTFGLSPAESITFMLDYIDSRPTRESTFTDVHFWLKLAPAGLAFAREQGMHIPAHQLSR